ncbi:MAG: nucleotide exchange factor GrpE [Thaumarchaeota archaeon]|nr:nucleotide exchange factor GrpE [Nitrososphaerota archaeon]
MRRILAEEENSGEGTARGPAEALNAERKKYEESLLRLKYLQADFENYRKRAEREMTEAEEASARSVAVKLLGVMDELELAMEHSKGTEGSELGEGVSMVYKKLNGVLESLGLRRIECVGKPFDPAYHEAVEKVEGTGKEDTVVQEVRSGFTFRGQVIRPSMVKVELARPKVVREEKKSE